MVIRSAADAVGNIAGNTGSSSSAETLSSHAVNAETSLAWSTGLTVGDVAERLADLTKENMSVNTLAASLGG